jgi:hypothetical protein
MEGAMAEVPDSEPIDADPNLIEIDDLDAVAGGRGVGAESPDVARPASPPMPNAL